jgi:hypothetical protein
VNETIVLPQNILLFRCSQYIRHLWSIGKIIPGPSFPAALSATPPPLPISPPALSDAGFFHSPPSHHDKARSYRGKFTGFWLNSHLRVGAGIIDIDNPGLFIDSIPHPVAVCDIILIIVLQAPFKFLTSPVGNAQIVGIIFEELLQPGHMFGVFLVELVPAVQSLVVNSNQIFGRATQQPYIPVVFRP